MNRKRLLSLGLVALMLFVLPVSLAYAHGHHGNKKTVSSGKLCALCTVEDCDECGLHTHDGTVYCGYSHKSGYCDGGCLSSGETCPVCTEEDCTVKGPHIHDGDVYCGGGHRSGCCDGGCFNANGGACGACTVKGCTSSGLHVHDGVVVCGQGYGYCHSGSTSSGHHHHGHH